MDTSSRTAGNTWLTAAGEPVFGVGYIPPDEPRPCIVVDCSDNS